jgi:hypothetical protein
MCLCDGSTLQASPSRAGAGYRGSRRSICPGETIFGACMPMAGSSRFGVHRRRLDFPGPELRQTRVDRPCLHVCQRSYQRCAVRAQGCEHAGHIRLPVDATRMPGEDQRKSFKYRLAIRNQPNAVALKTLWIDVDTKITEDPKKPKDAYKDLTEAAEALAAFIKAAGLPRPSMIVCSGGGLQPYWVMSRALTPDEWRPLAFALAEATKRHGLKCDAGCTIDSARVFRIPNTCNNKVYPPLPTRIVGNPADFTTAPSTLKRRSSRTKSHSPRRGRRRRSS